MALNSGEGKDDLDVTLSAGDDEVSSSLARVISTPINLFISLLSTAFGALRPFSSQLVPILVCAIFIPLLLFLSVSAGWVVWNNVAIGWEEPLSLQYGYVPSRVSLQSFQAHNDSKRRNTTLCPGQLAQTRPPTTLRYLATLGSSYHRVQPCPWQLYDQPCIIDTDQ